MRRGLRDTVVREAMVKVGDGQACNKPFKPE